VVDGLFSVAIVLLDNRGFRMDNQQVQSFLQVVRSNTNDSALWNMKNAIDGGAPVAALVYGLAYIGAMSGFYCRGKDHTRYHAFVTKYLAPGLSGCDYSTLDLYHSLRCPMLHGLVPGQRQAGKGKYVFRLTQGKPDRHGKRARDGLVWFDVEVFCSDALGAARQFIKEVEESISISPEPTLLKDFKARMAEGYSIMVSERLRTPMQGRNRVEY
jgi:hypothetical protein